MANKIAIAREQKIIVMKETTRGTLVAPASTGLIIAAGMGMIKQQASFTNSSEVNDSRDILNRFQDRTPPGEWSFPVYLRPSGTAGTAPQEDVLLECLRGKKTVDSGISVVYAPAKEKPSFSLWLKKDHTVFHGSGATVGNGKFALATKGGSQLDLSGKFMKLGWAGTSATAALAASGATAIVLAAGEAKKYTVGAMIEFVEAGVVKNNTDAGYKITAVNLTTHTLTIPAPGLEEEIASGSIVRGWLPAGTEVGTPLEARKGKAQVDAVDFPVQTMDITIADDPRYLDDEITASGYVEEYAEVERNISGNLAVYFRQNDVAFWHDGINNVERALKMIVGTVAGKIVEVATPRASLSVPDVTEQDPTLALSLPYQALGENGEDSISITYK